MNVSGIAGSDFPVDGVRSALREIAVVVIIDCVPHASDRWVRVVRPAIIGRKGTILAGRQQRVWKRGQVAQVVERSPEKAGVGGSTPSLATILFKTLAIPVGSP